MSNDPLRMSKEEKTKLLTQMALSVFEHPEYQSELQHLLRELNLRQEEVIAAYVHYDLDIFAYDNEIYDPLVMRMVLHIHNLLAGSWHIDRQKNIIDLIDLVQPRSIIDIGFGVPSLYIKKNLLNPSYKIVLTDLSESAFTFARELLSLWSKNWQQYISILCEDMIETSEAPPSHDLYLFQDSIEHVPDPTKCLSDFVKNTLPTTKFILSLPIGPITPIHYIAWDTAEEIRDWLNKCGLQIVKEKHIKVNPDVDLFAEQLKFDYSNMVVLCEKN